VGSTKPDFSCYLTTVTAAVSIIRLGDRLIKCLCLTPLSICMTLRRNAESMKIKYLESEWWNFMSETLFCYQSYSPLYFVYVSCTTEYIPSLSFSCVGVISFSVKYQKNGYALCKSLTESAPLLSQPSSVFSLVTMNAR